MRVMRVRRRSRTVPVMTTGSTGTTMRWECDVPPQHLPNPWSPGNDLQLVLSCPPPPQWRIMVGMKIRHSVSAENLTTGSLGTAMKWECDAQPPKLTPPLIPWNWFKIDTLLFPPPFPPPPPNEESWWAWKWGIQLVQKTWQQVHLEQAWGENVGCHPLPLPTLATPPTLSLGNDLQFIYCQLRARSVLLQLKDVPLRTRRALSP